MKKTANLIWLGLVLGLFVGALNAVKQVMDMPVVQMTYPDKECVRVITKDGKKDCSWLEENQVRKYHVEYVMK